MKADFKIDCFGLLCPMPIIKTSQKIKEMQIGQVLEVVASDEGIKSDMPAWCKTTGQELVKMEEKDGEYKVYVKKVSE